MSFRDVLSRLLLRSGEPGGTMEDVPAKRDVLPPRRAAPARGLKEELAAYGHDLARRGMSIETCRKRKAIAEALVEATEARSGPDFTIAAAQDFLSARCERQHWTAKTHDNALDSLKDFGRFLEGRGFIQESPFARIKKSSRRAKHYGTTDTGVRAFTIEEQAAIVIAAEAGRSRNSRRDLCYRLFGLTGLRFKEMRLLPWPAVFIDEPPYKIVCDQGWTKNQRTQEIPLNPEAVEILLDQRTRTGKGVRVWTTMPSRHTLDRDMEAAGVAKIDKRGRSAAFHSFRKGLNTEGGRLLIPLEVRMRLMRHGDPRLTAGTYADVLTADMVAAVASLPRLGGVVHGLSTSEDDGNVDLTERPTRGHDPPRAAMRSSALPNSATDRATAPGPAVGYSLQHNVAAGSGPARGPGRQSSRRNEPGTARGNEWSRGDSNPRAVSIRSPRLDPDSPAGAAAAAIVDAFITALFAFRDSVTGRPHREPDHGSSPS